MTRSTTDAADIERLSEAGRSAVLAGEHADAAAAWRELAALWTGPSLADVGTADFADVARVRLDEARCHAVESAVDAELALGRHALVAADIELFVEQFPARERAARLLLLARYRLGRQDDALDAFDRTSDHLVKHYGLERMGMREPVPHGTPHRRRDRSCDGAPTHV